MDLRTPRVGFSLCILMALLLSARVALAAEGVDFVWIEGEQPTASNVKANLSGWGNKQFLSGENWLHLSVDAEKVKEMPAEGALFEYAFTAPKDGKYEIWNRIGMEFVRSPFSWRIDEGAWATIKPDDLTTDLMDIALWCEVAWIKMGDQQLAKGPHKLQIKPLQSEGQKGKPGRILYASDALCLTVGAFVPNSKFKPNETGRDEKDLQAEKTVFAVPVPASAEARASVPLKGLWEVCRFDEQIPGDVAKPIADLPKNPIWKAIEVPGDKNSLRPDLIFAHRLWYRTRVEVPASLAGRSFHIVFPQNNLNTTVVVNGVMCGFNKNPFARFQIDITQGIKPGVNEVWVGIRDAWYGYSTNPNDPMKLRKKFNLPLEVTQRGFQDLAYPIWHHFQSGILVTPELVVAGAVKSADVFCKPSVSKKELAVEVTLSNTTGKAAAGEIVCEAINPKTKQVEKTFAGKPFAISGGELTVTLLEKWEDAKLWWPDEPNLYTLRTTVKLNGKAVDVADTTFGFREWSWEGRDYKLNGIVWHGWADCFTAPSPKDWIEFYRKSNQRMMRFWGVKWQNLPPEEALSFFDQNGVIVRRSGILDGEAIGYNAIENDPDLKKESPIKMDLMRNWQDQMVAQVKGERNHPSVMIWSIENEWLYINCINLYGNLMDTFEAEVLKVTRAVMAADPTRPVMTDGGGANKDNTMPVHGNHYVMGDFPRYPTLAYEAFPEGGGRGRWVWDQKRPRFIGEDFFANGINPFDYSYFGGEETFQGKAQSRRAAGIIFRMLTEGYRWAEQGAWHFWMSQNEATNQYGSNAPIAIFCKQWDWTFGSGQDVKRTMRLFNDSRFDNPITFTWALNVGGQKIAGESKEYRVAAGTASQPFELKLTMPQVKDRTEGELVLTLAVGGKEVFKETKAVSVLNPQLAVKPALKQEELLVCDPSGGVAKFLTQNGIAFTALADLKALPESGKVLIIGKDGIASAECDSTKFQAYAAPGRCVIVLDQKNPLRYSALPAEMELASNEGRTAFVEDLEHPVFKGLSQKDFFTWGDDQVVYRDAYGKPARGGKSLVQCDNRLANSAMVEIPAGKGLLLVSQLLIGEKLADNATAQKLLANLLTYAASYKQEFRSVVVCTKEINPFLAQELENIKLKYTKAADPIAAITPPEARTAIIPASPANLKTLVANQEKVRAFTAAGGQIFFHDLTPEGLADYNKLVGFDHMIRPFWRERVGLPVQRNPLTAGLTLGDVVMRSGERIFGWTKDEYVASDIFTYIVDYEDVAPFAQFSNDFNKNMVNGMVSADGWKYIVNLPVPEEGSLDFTLKLPKEQEIREVEWVGNTFYWPVTKFQLVFDGNAANAATFTTEPNNEPQVFPVEPTRKGKEILLRLTELQKLPDKRAVTGLDNIALKAKRSPEFYKTVKPMLNIGGLMQYVHGSGGMVLCNLKFQQSEAVPENAGKKRTILATLLRNLKAPFAEGKSIIAGGNLRYTTLDISKQANQFRDEQGWFGDKNFTFKDLPVGRQTFAGVPYQVYDFPTSPVPTVIMLNGPRVPNKLANEVRGIPVNLKADALFFLHTARLDNRMSERDHKQKKKFEMAKYVVNYADGRSVNIPVHAEIDIEDFRQKEPKAIPGAQIAWVKPYAGKDLSAVAYSKQWNNPRPEVEIKSIDLVYGEQKRGVPALIAVTAASAQ